jgi:hypothetical protein
MLASATPRKEFLGLIYKLVIGAEIIPDEIVGECQEKNRMVPIGSYSEPYEFNLGLG